MVVTEAGAAGGGAVAASSVYAAVAAAVVAVVPYASVVVASLVPRYCRSSTPIPVRPSSSLCWLQCLELQDHRVDFNNRVIHFATSRLVYWLLVTRHVIVIMHLVSENNKKYYF